jgi:hypothetical protein
VDMSGNKYTGHFLMYSRITKIYYRKTVGNVFTKPVHRTNNPKIFFPVSCFFYHSSHFCHKAVRVYVVRKWLLRGRSHLVCWNIIQVSLWLLCNVHFVQSTLRTRLQTRRFVCGTDHCSSEEYRCTHVDVCVAKT